MAEVELKALMIKLSVMSKCFLTWFCENNGQRGFISMTINLLRDIVWGMLE